MSPEVGRQGWTFYELSDHFRWLRGSECLTLIREESVEAGSWCYCPNAGGYRHRPTAACHRDTPTAIYPDRYFEES